MQMQNAMRTRAERWNTRNDGTFSSKNRYSGTWQEKYIDNAAEIFAGNDERFANNPSHVNSLFKDVGRQSFGIVANAVTGGMYSSLVGAAESAIDKINDANILSNGSEQVLS